MVKGALGGGGELVGVQTYVEFRSERFLPIDGEQEQVNPGLWGKRLADFIREGLRGEGSKRRNRSRRIGVGLYRS